MVDDDHVWVLAVQGPGPALTTVDDEIVDVLGRDPQVWAIAMDLLGAIEAGECPDLHTWPGAVALLTEYRHRGGVVSCPLDAVAVAVRALLAGLARDLDATAARVRGGGPQVDELRDALRAGAGRIRAALGEQVYECDL